MPFKPPHPCNRHGCPELTHSRFCKNCEVEASRAYDAERGSAAKRGYDSRHRKWRLLILHRNPICRMCGRNASTVADHIIPLPEGGWSLENGQGLCAPCHGTKTGSESRGKQSPF